MKSPIWDAHENTVKSYRMLSRKIIDLMWSDVVTQLPHLEDDPDVVSVRRQAEDAHARLFDILMGMSNIFRTATIRHSNR